MLRVRGQAQEERHSAVLPVPRQRRGQEPEEFLQQAKRQVRKAVRGVSHSKQTFYPFTFIVFHGLRQPLQGQMSVREHRLPETRKMLRMR